MIPDPSATRCQPRLALSILNRAATLSALLDHVSIERSVYHRRSLSQRGGWRAGKLVAQYRLVGAAGVNFPPVTWQPESCFLPDVNRLSLCRNVFSKNNRLALVETERGNRVKSNIGNITRLSRHRQEDSRHGAVSQGVNVSIEHLLADTRHLEIPHPYRQNGSNSPPGPPTNQHVIGHRDPLKT